MAFLQKSFSGKLLSSPSTTLSSDKKSAPVNLNSDEELFQAQQEFIRECLDEVSISTPKRIEAYRDAMDEVTADKAFSSLNYHVKRYNRGVKYPDEKKEIQLFIDNLKKSLANDHIPKTPQQLYREKIILAFAFFKGLGVQKDYKESFKRFNAINVSFLAEKETEHPIASCMLGWHHELGLGTPADAKSALSCYQAAARLNNGLAIFSLGKIHEEGALGQPENPHFAFTYASKAAALEDVGAMNDAGYSYLKGRGVARDAEEALTFFSRAAKLGNAVALNNVGCAHKDGRSVPQDLAFAAFCFRIALLIRGDLAMTVTTFEKLLSEDELETASTSVRAQVFYHAAMTKKNIGRFKAAFKIAPQVVVKLLKADLDLHPWVEAQAKTAMSEFLNTYEGIQSDELTHLRNALHAKKALPSVPGGPSGPSDIVDLKSDAKSERNSCVAQASNDHSGERNAQPSVVIQGGWTPKLHPLAATKNLRNESDGSVPQDNKDRNRKPSSSIQSF